MTDLKRQNVTVRFRFNKSMEKKKGENLQCLLGDAKTLSLYLLYSAPPAEIIVSL